MKKFIPIIVILLSALGFWLYPVTRARAVEEKPLQVQEYVTIRWGGRDNTHLIRSNGRVEFLGPVLSKAARPDRVDDRAYYMNIAMNAVAKEGYEFAGMTSDEIIMKRSASR